MRNPESVLEKKTHKLPWDFEIQMDNLISARRLDLVIVNKRKRTWWIVDFAILADHRVKLNEYEKRDKYLALTIELKNILNMKVTVIPIVISALGSFSKGLGNKRTNWDHPNYGIFYIGQNTKETPWDLRRLAVILTLVENHQLTLVWKTPKGAK